MKLLGATATALTLLAGAAAAQVDVRSVSCESYGAASADEKLHVIGALRIWAADGMNAEESVEWQAALIDKTDDDVNALIEVKCLEKTGATPLLEVVKEN